MLSRWSKESLVGGQPTDKEGDFGAGGENRTRDIQLGKLTFYL
jgi:hypothetical protein